MGHLQVSTARVDSSKSPVFPRPSIGFVADSTKLARVWDVSRYPAHALYVGEEYRSKRAFRDGREWARRGIGQQAFSTFATESQIHGATPFGDPGELGYADSFRLLGFGNHPAMTYRQGGTSLSVQTVENTLSEPLVPPRP